MGLDMGSGTAPLWVLYGALAAAGGLLLVAFWAGAHAAGGRSAARTRMGPGGRGDVLTAVIASVVAADGMWATFAGLGMPIPLRVATFAFIELAVVQSARRAHRSMRESYSAGVDGIAMWALTCVSAILSAAHEALGPHPNAAVVLVRLVAPLVAAWGWERNMALERRRRRGLGSGVTWRFTAARIAVKLGLAEVGERGVDEVDAHRRLARVARAVDRARTLQQADARTGRRVRALARAKRAWAEADEYAKLSSRPEMRQALLEMVSGLYNVAAFVEMRVAPWWDADAGAQPVAVAAPLEMRADAGAGAPVADAPEVRVPDAAGEAAQAASASAPVADLASHLPHVDRARQAFAGELERGEVPSLRRIQSELRVGQKRAQQLQRELRDLAS